MIVDAVPEAVVHLGFRRPVEPDELAGWVTGQKIAAMLSATNQVPVRPGDAVLVPAGLPHAIGPGIFLVEAQEPTDFSVLLEREGFAVDESAAFLGLDVDLALSCVDRRAWPASRLVALSRERNAARLAASWSIRAPTFPARSSISARSLATRSSMNATGVSSGCSKAARLYCTNGAATALAARTS